MLLCSAVIFILSVINSSISILEGEFCNLGNGEIGICETIFSCESVINDLAINKKPPKVTCGYKRQTPIVCCSQKNKTTTVPPPVQESQYTEPIAQNYGKVSSQSIFNRTSTLPRPVRESQYTKPITQGYGAVSSESIFSRASTVLPPVQESQYTNPIVQDYGKVSSESIFNRTSTVPPPVQESQYTKPIAQDYGKVSSESIFNRASTVPPPVQESQYTNPIAQEYGKVSSENCKNYSSLVLKNISSPILLPDVDYEIEDTCAIQTENYKENTVKAREFPHLVSIGYDSLTDRVWKCSGALISQQHVLTAATCFNFSQLSNAKYVRVGSTSVRENFYHEKPLQYSYIKEFIKHPNFDQKSLSNNLAIIKLKSAINFTSVVRPGCLALRNNNEKEAISVGWSTLTNGGYLNNEPTKNLLTIKNPRLCNNLKPDQICVEQPYSSHMCVVDQGSPLQQYHENHYCTYDIIGIVSEWKDCQRGTLGVYTNVSMHIPWIEKIVWG